MAGTKRPAPESRMSQARPMAASPVAQPRPVSRPETGSIHDQLPEPPASQQIDWTDIVGSHASVDPSLEHAFLPTEMFHFGQPAPASFPDLFGSYVEPASRGYGTRSSHSDFETSWNDYQPMTHKGSRYPQGGRQAHGNQSYDTSNEPGAILNQQDYMYQPSIQEYMSFAPPTEDDLHFNFGLTNELEFPPATIDNAKPRSATFDEYSENSLRVFDGNSLSPASASTRTTLSEDDQIPPQPSLIVKLKVKVSHKDPISPHPAKRRSDEDSFSLPPAKRRRRQAQKPSIRMADNKVSPTTYKISNGIREPVPSLKPSGLYFSNRAEARRSVGRLNWEPPANEPTIPATDDEMATWVLTLRQAMEDMSSYVDSESKGFQKRWLDANWVTGRQPQNGDTVTNPYYPLHWMEEKCWKIVELCTRLHRFGTSIISCRDPYVLERSFLDKHHTFEQRMNLIIELASKCKNRVGEILCGGVIEEYLLTPRNLIHQTNDNRDNNNKRQRYIKEGRTVKATSKKSTSSDSAEAEDEPESDYQEDCRLHEDTNAEDEEVTVDHQTAPRRRQQSSRGDEDLLSTDVRPVARNDPFPEVSDLEPNDSEDAPETSARKTSAKRKCTSNDGGGVTKKRPCSSHT